MHVPEHAALRMVASRIPGRAAFGALLSTLVYCLAIAQPHREIGIDRSGLRAQSLAVQRKTLAGIGALHAVWFRDGQVSGSAQGVVALIEEIRLAKQQNLKVLVTIVQLDEDYDIPLLKNAKPLSKIDLARFGQRRQALHSALKAAGLVVDAVEFGNEDDTAYYDADVPSGHLASRAEIQTRQGFGAVGAINPGAQDAKARPGKHGGSSSTARWNQRQGQSRYRLLRVPTFTPFRAPTTACVFRVASCRLTRRH